LAEVFARLTASSSVKITVASSGFDALTGLSDFNI
jgi:hypothetical protein